MAKAAKRDEGITSETRTVEAEQRSIPAGYLTSKASEIPFTTEWNPLVEDPHVQVLPEIAPPPVDPSFVPQQVLSVRLAGSGDEEVPQVISRLAVDTPTYGTETPPRQTPPTNLLNPIAHSPPSDHSATGEPGGGYTPPAGAAPELVSIAPSTAVVGDADLTLTAIGTGFDAGSVITFNGTDETTTYASPTELTTIVKPSLASGASDVPVTVRSAAGESAAQTFSFTAPAGRRK